MDALFFLLSQILSKLFEFLPIFSILRLLKLRNLKSKIMIQQTYQN